MTSRPLHRSRERALIVVLVIVFVVFRSAMFVFKPGLDFDADQATVGLMGKHLIEGRAFPLFLYGENYLLAVEAWLAAPSFWLFGVSVAALKLPLLLINIAIGLLLIVLLERETGLRPYMALVASLPFVLASPEASATMLKTLGGTVEPLLYVLLLWMTRRRPNWFGLIAAIGFLHREFTIYGVVAVVLILVAEGSWRTKAGWVWSLHALRTVAGVWLIVQFLKMVATPFGPGTTAADLLASPAATNNITNLLGRFCFDSSTVLPSIGGLATVHWTRLFGTRMQPISAFGLIGDAVQGIPYAGWMFGPAAAFLVVRAAIGAWAARGEWRRYQFPLYLTLVGALSASVLAVGRCGAVEIIRYDLLSILGAVGLAALFFAVERQRVMRGVATGVIVAWAAVSVLGHARIWAEYERRPPVGDKMLIVRNLEARGIKYAISDYWIAYYVTFMTNERIIVSSTDIPRIVEYGQQLDIHRAEAIRISRSSCGGGRLIFEGVYFCPPE